MSLRATARGKTSGARLTREPEYGLSGYPVDASDESIRGHVAMRIPRQAAFRCVRRLSAT